MHLASAWTRTKNVMNGLFVIGEWGLVLPQRAATHTQRTAHTRSATQTHTRACASVLKRACSTHDTGHPRMDA